MNIYQPCTTKRVLLNAAHTELARTLLEVTCSTYRPFEVLPPPSLSRVWDKVRVFGTLLTRVLRGHDAVLHVNPGVSLPTVSLYAQGQAKAEVRIPILSPTMPTVDLVVKYCYIINGKPVYQSGVESTVTPGLYHYAMGSACSTIDELPKVIDWVRTTRQCKMCHYSSDNGMYCGLGLVGDGYCSKYLIRDEKPTP